MVLAASRGVSDGIGWRGVVSRRFEFGLAFMPTTTFGTCSTYCFITRSLKRYYSRAHKNVCITKLRLIAICLPEIENYLVMASISMRNVYHIS